MGDGNHKSQEPPSELRPPSRVSVPSTARRIGGWSFPVLSAIRPAPHRFLSALLFAALLLLSGGNALAQGNVAGDKAALETLYDATDGPNWTTSTLWTTTAPLSAWHGVTTDSAGRVTHLALFGNELTGTIPEKLGDLSNLTSLSLRNNQLTGTIPSALGDLSNLQYLYLNDNELTGTIPEELGDLSNLQWLYAPR